LRDIIERNEERRREREGKQAVIEGECLCCEYQTLIQRIAGNGGDGADIEILIAGTGSLIIGVIGSICDIIISCFNDLIIKSDTFIDELKWWIRKWWIRK
jgi:hypothetical protein